MIICKLAVYICICYIYHLILPVPPPPPPISPCLLFFVLQTRTNTPCCWLAGLVLNSLVPATFFVEEHWMSVVWSPAPPVCRPMCPWARHWTLNCLKVCLKCEWCMNATCREKHFKGSLRLDIKYKWSQQGYSLYLIRRPCSEIWWQVDSVKFVCLHVALKCVLIVSPLIACDWVSVIHFICK